MSTNFVHLVGLLFGVFCFASLHQAQSMVIFTNTNTTLKEELMNSTKINVVNGDQYLSKRLESPVALTEAETVRDPRMTVIENQVVRGGSYYRPKRELLVEGDKTRDRRETYIRFNEVNGNQHTSKKRESPVAPTEPEIVRHRRSTNIETSNVAFNQIMFKKRASPLAPAEPETTRDRRMTIIESPIYYGYPVSYSQAVASYPSIIGSREYFRPSQWLTRLQNSANWMFYPSRAVSSSSTGTQYQYASAPLASVADPSAQRVSLSATPNFVSSMTVNGNQYLSKK